MATAPAPANETTIPPPPAVIEGALETPLSQSLGDWRAAHPGDRIILGAFPNWRAIASPNGVSPVEGIYCARVEGHLLNGSGWELTRQVFFTLVAPVGAPLAGMRPDEIRDRYCRSVVVGLELIGDSIDSAPDSLELSQWRKWNVAGGTTPRHSWEGGFELPTNAQVLGPDGTARGSFSGQVGDGISCFELVQDLEAEGEAVHPCVALFRSDTGAVLAWESGALQSQYSPEGFNLGWMIRAAAPLPYDQRQVLEALAHDHSENETGGTADSALIDVLHRVRRSVDSATGDRRTVLMILLDLAMHRGVETGHLGPDGDAGPDTDSLLRSLGGEYSYMHLGAVWVDSHAWLDSADRAAPRGELGDSLFKWYLVPVWKCGEDGRAVLGHYLDQMRKYTSPDRSSRTRARAFLTIAQSFADSITGGVNDRIRAALVDSISTSLLAGLSADPTVEHAADAHGALWRARAGLIPLPRRIFCGEGD